MAFNEWQVRTVQKRIDAETAARLSLPPLLRRCLEARGVTEPEEIEAAVGSGSAFFDPFLLPDMERAATRITAALENQEKITVYGDYDVDGVTSAYLLSRELKRLGADCSVYIPDRVGEGYGMNIEAVEKIAADGTRLIVTVDCGVTAVEEIARAYALGMQVVVTDHHEPQEVLPACEAVVDPKRADSVYPFRELAGVGVAFKLVCALRGENASAFEDYGDIIALGTVADVVSLIMENRRIVSEGLEKLLYTQNKGLAALNRAAGFCDAAHSAADVAFKLTPKLNAAGRMRSAYEALALLQSGTDDEADRRAAYLCALNTERQAEEGRVSAEAEAMLDARRVAENHAVVLAGATWKHGIVGISAAKLTEKYGWPVVLFAPDGELLRGSARSVEGFDVFEALTRAAGALGTCGGHKMAAGVTIPAVCFEEFRERFEAVCRGELASGGPVCALRIDCEVRAAELDRESVASLSRLEPFGAGNERPVFCLRNARVEELIPIGSGKHLRMAVSAEGKRLSVIAFRRQRERFRYACGDFVDLAFTAELDTYRGVSSVKLFLNDILPCGERRARESEAVRLLRAAAAGERPAGMAFPDRRVLGAVWRRTAELAPGGAMTPALVHCGLPAAVSEVETLVALTAFEEAGLIECDRFGAADFNGEMTVRVCAGNSQKADLSATKIYAVLCGQG